MQMVTKNKVDGIILNTAYPDRILKSHTLSTDRKPSLKIENNGFAWIKTITVISYIYSQERLILLSVHRLDQVHK